MRGFCFSVSLTGLNHAAVGKNALSDNPKKYEDMTSYSTLQRRLLAGQVVVTGELAPPKGAARATLERLALGMRDAVDAINLTDNQRGVGRMSALGAGVVMRQLGIEPIV